MAGEPPTGKSGSTPPSARSAAEDHRRATPGVLPRQGRTRRDRRVGPDDPFLARSLTLPIRRVPLTGQQKRILILVAIALLLAVIGGVAGTRLLTRPRKVRRSVQADLRILRVRYRAALQCLAGPHARRDGRDLAARLAQRAIFEPRWPETLARCRRLAARLAAATEGVAGAADAVSDRVPSAIRARYHEARDAASALLEAVTRIAEHAIAGYRLPPPAAAKAATQWAARYGQHLDQVASLADLPSQGESRPSDLPPAPAYAQPGRLTGLTATAAPRHGLALRPALSTRHPLRSTRGVLLRPVDAAGSAASPHLLHVTLTGETRWLRPVIPATPPGATAGALRFLALSDDPAWPLPRPQGIPAAGEGGKGRPPCATPLLWARALWNGRTGRGALQVGISCAAEGPPPPSSPRGHPRRAAARQAPASPTLAHKPRRVTPRPITHRRRHPAHGDTRHWTLRALHAVGVAPRPEGGVLGADGSAWILASVPAGVGRSLLRFRLLPGGRWAPPQVLCKDLAAQPQVSIWPLGRQAPLATHHKATKPGTAAHAISALDRSGHVRFLLLGPSGARARARLPIHGALRALCGDSTRLYALDAEGTLWSIHGAKPHPTRLWSAEPGARGVRMSCLADRAAVAWRSRSSRWPHPLAPPAGGRRASPSSRLPAPSKRMIAGAGGPGYLVCGPTGCSEPILTSWSRITTLSLVPSDGGIALLLSGPDTLLLRRDPHARGSLSPPRLVTAWRAPPDHLYAAARPHSGAMLLVFDETRPRAGQGRPASPTHAGLRLRALVTRDAGVHWETP